MLGQISSAVAEEGINIENMVNRGRDDYAYTLVDINEDDEAKVAAVAKKLAANPEIIRVRVIKNETGAC